MTMMQNKNNSSLHNGALLMLIGAVGFIGYAVIFFARNFVGTGFELGVETLNGVTRAQLNAFNPGVLPYIQHLHIATAGFIAATGIAVAGLAWYGVRRGMLWAWVAAVVSPVVGLAVALPMHYTGLFEHNWVHTWDQFIWRRLYLFSALYGRSKESLDRKM